MSFQWYALHSKPRMEACVAGQLSFQQIEHFYPAYPARPVNPRSRKIKPYFPGYLFVSVDLEKSGSANLDWMPGTVGLVHYGGQPVSVPEYLIEAIRQRVQKLNDQGHSSARFRPGEAVRVAEGPLAGMQGIFDLNLRGSQRARVLLKLLGEHFMRVELPAAYIEPIKQL